jgi:hypothetical protein
MLPLRGLIGSTNMPGLAWVSEWVVAVSVAVALQLQLVCLPRKDMEMRWWCMYVCTIKINAYMYCLFIWDDIPLVCCSGCKQASSSVSVVMIDGRPLIWVSVTNASYSLTYSLGSLRADIRSNWYDCITASLHHSTTKRVRDCPDYRCTGSVRAVRAVRAKRAAQAAATARRKTPVYWTPSACQTSSAPVVAVVAVGGRGARV